MQALGLVASLSSAASDPCFVGKTDFSGMSIQEIEDYKTQREKACKDNINSICVGKLELSDSRNLFASEFSSVSTQIINSLFSKKYYASIKSLIQKLQAEAMSAYIEMFLKNEPDENKILAFNTKLQAALYRKTCNAGAYF